MMKQRIGYGSQWDISVSGNFIAVSERHKYERDLLAGAVGRRLCCCEAGLAIGSREVDDGLWHGFGASRAN